MMMMMMMIKLAILMKFPKTGLPFDFPTFAVFKIVQPEVEVHGDQGSLARQEKEKKY